MREVDAEWSFMFLYGFQARVHAHISSARERYSVRRLNIHQKKSFSIARQF